MPSAASWPIICTRERVCASAARRSGVGSPSWVSPKKKSLFAAEQERPDVKAQRDAWLDALTDLCAGDFARVSFLDESGALTNLVRTYARSGCGERCVVGLAPQGHWKVMTAVAAVRLDGLMAPFTIDCPMDGEIFGVYVERVLVPTLRRGDVVVMDNLTAHKRPRVRRLIEAAGASPFRNRFGLPRIRGAERDGLLGMGRRRHQDRRSQAASR
jgi:hypothetical protein